MDFHLTDEQKMIKKTAQEIGKDFGPEYWREKEENGEFGKDFWRTLGKIGITGIHIPEEYGGAGMGMMEVATAVEELCAGGCGGAGAWYLLIKSILPGIPIVRYGDEEQKEKWLPKIAKGEKEFCFGLTEPEAGSNSLNVSTFAEKDEDEYIVNGEKIFISESDRADAILLVTRTSKPDEVESRTEGLTIFITEMSEDNMEIQPIPKHGFNYSKTCELYIDDLRVSEDDVLGKEGGGWYQLLSSLNPERITAAFTACGIGKLAMDHAVEYAKNRKVFDVPIGSHQGIQFPLAKSRARIETASLMGKKAAWMFDQGEKCGPECNTAKVAATNAGIEAVYHSMQTFGGYGYAKEYDVERWWREINLTRLAPVTQQMAYNYIATQVLGLPRSY